jgi:prepilin-type N-terminal cleavage/methylation domain-containing protein
MARLRRQGATTDRGFTLIEMLVTLMLVSVVGAVVMTIMVSSARVARKQEDHTHTLSAAKVAMERITREIRGANAMTVAQPRTMSFTATVNGVRTATTFTVVTTGSTSEIREQQSKTVVSTGVMTTTTRKVLGGMAVGRSDAVFSYADASGVPLVPATTSPESYTPGAVKSVSIKVLVKRRFNNNPVELEQTVSIRNFEV